jgi:hypothetical protein
MSQAMWDDPLRICSCSQFQNPSFIATYRMILFTNMLLPFQYFYKTVFENVPVFLTAAANVMHVLPHYFVMATELCRSNKQSVVDLSLSEFYDLLMRCICMRRLSYWCDHIRFPSASLYPSHTAWTRNQEALPHFPGSISWNFCELNRRSFGDVHWPEHYFWGYQILQNTCCSWHKVTAVLRRQRTNTL